ncbi:MAG: Cysteine synthase [Firmicutes bacterium]|nr:Cysteine synthase [Bacillota bacterium]MDI6705201.1 cysteine synthase A [Bacillota bacterium]
MQIAGNVTELIGSTPVVRLNKLVKKGDAEVLVKLEYFNPGGSVKDRIALNMILEAEKQGKINKNTVIVEPTSGNTGIGLAMVAAARGYKLLLVMPDTMSEERRKLMKALGADFLLTPGEEGMKGAVKKAEELTAQNPNYFMPQQFNNPANPAVHARTTAREILAQVDGKLDAFVAGVGTGGTITGVGKVLKQEIPHIRIIAVEPEKSPVLSGGTPGPHKIQGIGAGFIPRVLDKSIIDEIITVKDEDALETARNLASMEGLLTGISSGAAVWSALKAADELGQGKRVLAIAPDTGERYLSMGLY